ncbi:MAG TPA: cation:proton antiporter [Terriglobales bacterium]|jgi:Kef-type K+ transport system membrane component KefB|nr:cation:proton antiporter [Terriglobales bacterium]
MPLSPEQFLLELFAVFVSAKVVGEIFERFRLPSVLGEILAGVVLGPYALGIIEPSNIIYSVAEIGAIFLLFRAGLEISPGDLIRVGGKAMQVAVVGGLLPFLLGFVYLKLRGDTSSEAVFVGAAMVATSVGITARVLADLGVLSTETARVILGAAVFDDIIGMVLLAVVSGFANGGVPRWPHLAILAGEAAGFAMFMIYVAPRIVRRMEPRVEHLSTQNASLVIALAICLLLSWLAARIGMAAIIGAFFAGLVFAEYAPQWNLVPRVAGITEFLSPFFFFAIGARLNLKLFTGNILVAAGVISFLAIISKILGCGLPLLSEGWETAIRVGVGMLPRGEVALIVALVGLQSGIVLQSTYAIVVFMTAVTTLIAPPILRYLFRQEISQSEDRATAAEVQL